jgi:hypoxanthine phosphoribosyltransferase
MMTFAAAIQVIKDARSLIDVGFWLRRTLAGGEMHFSIGMVERSVRRLDRKIRSAKYQPNLVVGMGSQSRVGGHIVGALLASPQHLNAPFVPLSNLPGQFQPNPHSLEHVLTLVPADGARTRILLVDEISKRGDTIRNVMQAIQAARPSSEVRAAALVRYSDAAVQQEFNNDDPVLSGAFWRKNYFVYVAKKPKVTFPWERSP